MNTLVSRHFISINEARIFFLSAKIETTLELTVTDRHRITVDIWLDQTLHSMANGPWI
jgi:hypothetical protein